MIRAVLGAALGSQARTLSQYYCVVGAVALAGGSCPAGLAVGTAGEAQGTGRALAQGQELRAMIQVPWQRRLLSSRQCY